MPSITPEQKRAKMSAWRNAVEELIRTTAGWAENAGWSVDKSEKILQETGGSYAAPTLRVRLPQGELRLDPVGMDVVGANGRVDMEAWPTLNRVLLLLHEDGWEIMTDSGVPLRLPWTRQTFQQLAHDLTATR